MKTRTSKSKFAETAVGVAVGAAIAGPIGAVAGGLAAGHVESGLDRLARFKSPECRGEIAADDPLIHVYPKRILVPLDFSPPSKRAMRFAREWAMLFRAEVFLLHVVEPTKKIVGPYGIEPAGADRRGIPGRARTALRELGRLEFPSTIPVSVLVRKGRAFDQITTAARDTHADIVIIATHGCHGLKHALIGSTAERVARHAPCPVLILRRGQTH